MWVIVGLGNPGAEYAQTRHNVGFMVVETIARRWSIALERCDAALRIGRGAIAGHPVLLAAPQMSMNCSGEGLSQCPRDADDEVVVFYDDIDLPSGNVRVRRSGRSAGHRGVASILAHVGEEFARVRVGIGRPPEGHDPADYVLTPLPAAQLVALRNDVERASDAVECVVKEGTQAAMNRFNIRVRPDTE
jgi:PTH1 family peptidyl-tRNA hydrolase